jgi:chaperonin GroES
MQTLKTTIEIQESITKVMKVKHDRVLIKRDSAQQFTNSGFEIPGNFLKNANTGIVLSSGARCKEVKESMHVLFGKNSGTDITINDETIVIMRESDIILDVDTKKPFMDKVLIKPMPAPKIIKGIYVPDNVEEQPQTGTVVDLGPDCEEYAIEDRVLYGKFAGLKITISNEEYLVIRAADIFAKLDDNE